MEEFESHGFNCIGGPDHDTKMVRFKLVKVYYLTTDVYIIIKNILS